MNFHQKVIAHEMDVFEGKFKDSMKSGTPLLDRIMRYIVKRKGKQLRPMFVILSAKLAGQVNDSTYRAAALVEILHTATLVHDDVVDDSLERRGFFSINALWKNKIAVLVGDYLFSKGLLLSLDNNDFRILQILSDAVRRLAEGELLQIEKARTLSVKEDIYFEIIKNKTASLLAAACAAGAYSSTQDEVRTARMREFGECVGVAFQIKDDLFDYGNEDVGKPTGNDIKEKKLTLPLIYTLNNVNGSIRRDLIYLVKNKNKDKEAVKQVIDTVLRSGGIDYASEKMFHYRDQAIAILNEFPENDEKRALEELVRYTTDRKF